MDPEPSFLKKVLFYNLFLPDSSHLRPPVIVRLQKQVNKKTATVPITSCLHEHKQPHEQKKIPENPERKRLPGGFTVRQCCVTVIQSFF